MAIEWLIVGAALGAGGMYLVDRARPMRNPTAPTYDDLEKNISISYQRNEYFVHVRGRQIGYWSRFDTAMRHVRKALAGNPGLKIYLLLDGNEVMLLDSDGNALETWDE